MAAQSRRRAARSWFVLPIVTLLLPMAGSPLHPRTSSASNPTAVLDPALTAAMAVASSPLSVVVTFRKTTAPSLTDVALLKQTGISQGFTFKSLPIAGVVATPAQINALAAKPEVRSLYLNAPLTFFNHEAREITGVSRAQSYSGMTAANGGLPLTGHGTTVLINDSGVDGTHGDLQYGSHLVQNTLGTTNLHAVADVLPVSYVEGVPNTDTNSGHGTHCAGIVGGTGAKAGGFYAGVAPDASLVGYGSGGALLVLDALGGFDYAMTKKDALGIDVISNSWGSSGDFAPDDPINVASYTAYKSGMIVVFAAGNEGPAEDTHNPYAKAPWVISVAAGTKEGALADFSSRGAEGIGGTFAFDGQTWTWEDRPTITAPGVDIISTRAVGPVSSLGAQDDIDNIDPLLIPFYTTMSGTSMATPHVAGIAALLREANPQITPAQVKQVLERTATNMPGHKAWEVGAGYVNAYAALDLALHGTGYGETLNLGHTFNSNVLTTSTKAPFTLHYNPIIVGSNSTTFNVPAGTTELISRIDALGLLEQTGNPVNLVLTGPDNIAHSSGVPILFATDPVRTVSVTKPLPGQWKLSVDGLHGDALNPLGAALPEDVQGTLTFKAAGGVTGLSDIGAHPAKDAIVMAVGDRLADGYADGTFKPDQALIRAELANYLTRGAGVRQFLPFDRAPSFLDVSVADRPFVEAVTALGAALKDRTQQHQGVMLPAAGGGFAPGAAVVRADLAYALVQSLGLEDSAVALNDDPVTVMYNGSALPIEDAALIPAALRGYVNLALNLNIMDAKITVTTGLLNLNPTYHATFEPGKPVTRAAFATTAVRFFDAFIAE